MGARRGMKAAIAVTVLVAGTALPFEAARAQSQGGAWTFSWVQLGGTWRSAPTRTASQTCPYTSRFACNAAYLGSYRNGEQQTFYKDGCGAPPIRIVCVVDPVGTPPPPPSGAGAGVAPGETFLRKVGDWDLRRHGTANGTLERCSITFERYKPIIWRISAMPGGRFVLTLPTHESVEDGARITTRYSVNRKYYDGVAVVGPGRRTALDITRTIGDFSVGSDATIPIRDRTYKTFLYSMPQAMNALRACVAGRP